MVTRGPGLFDRLGLHAPLLEPCRRAPMQGRHSVGLLLHRMRAQNVGEKVVIAVPVTLVIQWNDEQVASLQGLQDSFSIFTPGDGIAQRAA